MNRSAAAVGLLLLAVGGWKGYHYYEASRLSPFAMWDSRVGAPFATYEKEASTELHERFHCRPLEGGVRLCEITTTGVAGLMRLALDESGRAMILQWRVADSSERMIEEAHKMAALWTTVPSTHSQHPTGDGRTFTRWVSTDQNWSASMADFTSSTVPGQIELVDERRLTRALDASAPALLQLAQRGLLDPEAVDAAVARNESAIAAATATLGAPGRALAAAAAAVPACGFTPGDSILAGNEVRSAFGDSASALLERAVAVSYPGLHLRLERRPYLVDASGAAEEVRILEPAERDDAFAFAISFPRRVKAVQQRLLAFGDSTGQCRASAEVIVARRDSASGQLVEVRRTDADADALATEITLLELSNSDLEPAVLVVKYAATYGTRSWVGEVDWDAVIAAAPGTVRISRRLPNAVGWKDPALHETAGMVLPGTTSQAGTDVSILYLDGNPPTRLILPGAPDDAASGWVLLDLVQ